MFLKYVGKQPRKIDNVLRTGIVWEGNGDIKEVSEPVGKRLLDFPDCWEECDAEGNAVVVTGGLSDVAAGGGNVELEEIANDPDALRKYAEDKYGVKLPGTIKKPEKMLEKIAELETQAAEAAGGKAPDVYNGVEITEELEPLRALAFSGGFSDDQEEAVKQAIEMLGGPGSEYYDQETGMPKLEPVKLLAGEFVTPELIDAVVAEMDALDELNKSDPAE